MLTGNESVPHGAHRQRRGDMVKDKRKARRRPIRYTAWLVVVAGQTQACALSDISDTGARIDVENANELPNRLLLWLSANGSARRTCSVVWRTKTQVGVRFEQRLAAADRATLVPRPSADREAAADVIAIGPTIENG
jgi:PilZ domain